VEKILMLKYDFLIINRSFWPIYPVIGESLLRLAEQIAANKKVAVVMQDHVGIKKKLKENNRGEKVNFFPSWAISNSSSSIVIRILDSIFFMFWVIFILIIYRPKNIYVSTDPPVFVPFIVALYSNIFKAKFIYHIQDIHPEATNTIFKINSYIFFLLRKIDNFTLRNANLLITLNEEMKSQILSRSRTKKKINIIENPSIPFKGITSFKEKTIGFSFTGNLGRLQRVPLLLEAIKKYYLKGGKLKFYFAGSGIYAEKISKASMINPLIKYKGLLTSEEAAILSSKYEWALLPIENEITKYAFPSKTSSYIFSGAKILAICDKDTSVANWVTNNKLGYVINPKLSELVDFFFKIEKRQLDFLDLDMERTEFKKRLNIDKFIDSLKSTIFSI
jgi:glycosyltransferase involved in cell wall biosynthesis